MQAHAEPEITVPLQGTVDAYREALLSQPSNPQIHLMLGNALAQQGEVSGALASYRLALDLDSGQVEVCVQLGKLLEEEGSTDEALSLYRQALRERPGDIRVLTPFAEALYAHKDHAAAVDAYTRLVELMPGDARSQIRLGSALLADQRPDEAVVRFEEVIKLKPEDAHVHFLLGNAYRDRGELNEAIRCYRRSLALGRRNPVAVCVQLGGALVKDGQLQAARVEYEKSIELAPDNPHLHFLLGNVHREQDEMEEAIACYRRSLGLGSQNPAAVYFQLGKVLERTGRTEEAVEAYAEGVRIKPNAQIFFLLGNAQRRLHHHREAISCYQRAIDMDAPNPFRLYRALAEVHVEVEETDAAITAYKKARDLQPEHAQVRSALDALHAKRL